MKTKVTIEDEDYELDFDKALKLGILTQPFSPLKVGDKFTRDEEEYIIASASKNQVLLTNIENGYRYCELVTVRNSNRISEEEWKQMRGGDSFRKIS